MCQNQHFYQLINNHDARGASWGSLTPSVSGSKIGAKEARCLDGIRVEFLALDPRVKPEDDSARGASWGSLAPPHNLFVACAVPQKSRCSHSALVENLERHDRTNGVEAGAGEAAGTALKVVCHIERIFRTG